jgi:hypothetical protein
MGKTERLKDFYLLGCSPAKSTDISEEHIASISQGWRVRPQRNQREGLSKHDKPLAKYVHEIKEESFKPNRVFAFICVYDVISWRRNHHWENLTSYKDYRVCQKEF